MLLDENDVRAMVRLVSEVAAVQGGHPHMKRFLMEGLGKLINADSWVWGLSCQRAPDKPQVYVSFLKEGFTERAFVKFLEACEHPEMIELASSFFMELKEKNTHLTRSRHEIADVKAIDESQAVQVWKAANIGPTILSLYPLDAVSSSMMGLYRHYGKPEFTPREIRIAHIVLTEVPWLHRQGWPEDRGVDVPELSKRRRLTLNLLTFGQSQKQIADNMGISVHTAQGYIKDLYRIRSLSSGTHESLPPRRRRRSLEEIVKRRSPSFPATIPSDEAVDRREVITGRRSPRRSRRSNLTAYIAE